MDSLVEIYNNEWGEKVDIEVSDGCCIIYMRDEPGDEAEICIPVKDAIMIAQRIIKDCGGDINNN